jgi:hypothetical protein
MDEGAHMIVRFMQSAFGRVLRIVVGALLVGSAAYLPLGLAVTALLIGTFIGVLGIAGVCPLAKLLGGDAIHVGRAPSS